MTTWFGVRRARLVATVSLSALVLAGCQTTSSFEREVGVAPIAADDRCGSSSQMLREAKGHFERDLISNALVGGVMGALVGGIASGGDARAIVGGAAAGAVGGGALAYYNQRRQEARDQAALAGTIYGDVQQESAEINRALVAFKQTRDCRLAEAERIKARYQAGEIDRSTAQSRLDQERQRYADDVKIARAIGAGISQRHKELDAATQQVARNSPDAARLYTRAAGVAQQTEEAEHGQRAPQTSGNGMSATTTLNVRTAPSADAPLVHQLAPGQRVTVLSSANERWSMVRLPGGTVAYAASNYLQQEPLPTAVASDPRHSDSVAAGSSNVTTQAGDLGNLVDSVPDEADTETKTVAALYEGVEKRIELERVTEAAAAQEDTAFTLES